MGFFKENKTPSSADYRYDTDDKISDTEKNEFRIPDTEGELDNMDDNDMDLNDDFDEITDETAVITAGLTVTGNLDSTGSIDVYGNVYGDVSCMGKLTVSGIICGAIGTNEIFANDAQIEGNVHATGSVKIGKGTVILGDVRGTSAVIAGAVKGNVDIEGPVIIDSTAVIVGDIKSKTVQINNGATIEGRCSQCYSNVDTSAIFDIHIDKNKNKNNDREEKQQQSFDEKIDTLENDSEDIQEKEYKKTGLENVTQADNLKKMTF